MRKFDTEVLVIFLKVVPNYPVVEEHTKQVSNGAMGYLLLENLSSLQSSTLS